jgi:hypothetical protein
MIQGLTFQFTVVLVNVMMHSARDRRRQHKTDGIGNEFPSDGIDVRRRLRGSKQESMHR